MNDLIITPLFCHLLNSLYLFYNITINKLSRPLFQHEHTRPEWHDISSYCHLMSYSALTWSRGDRLINERGIEHVVRHTSYVSYMNANRVSLQGIYSVTNDLR